MYRTSLTLVVVVVVCGSGGGGSADGEYDVRVSPCMSTRMQLIKMDQ